jgi:hypothetical protein
MAVLRAISAAYTTKPKQAAIAGARAGLCAGR